MVLVIVAALLLVVGASGFALYRSAMDVRAEASEVMDEVSSLSSALEEGDTDSLDASVATIRAHTASINEEVHGTLWTLATYVPLVGEDFSSIQTLGTAAQDLVDNALVPVAQSLSGVSLSSLVQDGAINVALLQSLADAVSGVLPVVQTDAAIIANLPEARIAQVESVLAKVREPVAQAQGLLETAGPALELLPQMLGSAGTRTYLVIAQNNSELRSTGGLPGSWGTLTVTDGVIEKGDFITILHRAGLSVDTTDEEYAAVFTNYNTDPAQVNVVADFSRVGEMSREYWIQCGYGDVDGVIAMDPVFLQSLLALTGGFTMEDGTVIDGTNAAEQLLSTVYWTYGNDGTAQDAFFSLAAAGAFSCVMDNLGEVNLSDLLDTVSAAGESGRLLMWLKDGDEEGLIELLGYDGKLSQDETSPVLGVYVNDDTYSKISWYAQVGTTIGLGLANEDGTTTYHVTTTIANTFDHDLAETSPAYVHGTNPDKRGTTDMLDYVYLYGPAGGSISNVQVSDDGLISSDENSYRDNTLGGLEVIRLRTHVLGGETITITYDVTVSAAATERLSLCTTPLAQDANMLNSVPA